MLQEVYFSKHTHTQEIYSIVVSFFKSVLLKRWSFLQAITIQGCLCFQIFPMLVSLQLAPKKQKVYIEQCEKSSGLGIPWKICIAHAGWKQPSKIQRGTFLVILKLIGRTACKCTKIKHVKNAPKFSKDVSKEANYQKANLQNNPRWGRIRFSQGSLTCLSNKRHQAANKWLGSWPFCSILYDYKVLEHRPGKRCPNISVGLTK